MSPSSHEVLWNKLTAFELDVPGARLPFGARLARDNGWTPDFAARVAQEYKKFLFLACVAGHPVTPSDEVDQAWHLHLTYSRSYWDELCAKVLKRPFHHEPTRGGTSEGEKFEDWYAKTLDSYRQHFGAAPPVDIWPPSAVRFGDAPHFRRVNVRRVWIVPKPRFGAMRSGWPRLHFGGSLGKIAPFALGLPLILAGCSRSQSLNPLDWYGDEFLALFWGLFLAILAGLTLFNRCLEGPDDAEFPAQPLEPYVVARLAQPGNLAVDSVLVALLHRGDIDISPDGIITPRVPHAPRHPFEAQVWAHIAGGNSLPTVHSGMRPVLQHLDAYLVNLRLVRAEASCRVSRVVSKVAWWMLFLLAGAKLYVGIERDRPVGWLFASCIAVGVVVSLRSASGPRLTKRGHHLLAHLRADREPNSTARLLEQPASWNAGAGLDGATTALVMGMALWGYSELDGVGLGALRQQMQIATSSSSGSDGGGGGDGGDGGGGGGCGGCGGCGGGD